MCVTARTANWRKITFHENDKLSRSLLAHWIRVSINYYHIVAVSMAMRIHLLQIEEGKRRTKWDAFISPHKHSLTNLLFFSFFFRNIRNYLVLGVWSMSAYACRYHRHTVSETFRGSECWWEAHLFRLFPFICSSSMTILLLLLRWTRFVYWLSTQLNCSSYIFIFIL